MSRSYRQNPGTFDTQLAAIAAELHREGGELDTHDRKIAASIAKTAVKTVERYTSGNVDEIRSIPTAARILKAVQAVKKMEKQVA